MSVDKIVLAYSSLPVFHTVVLFSLITIIVFTAVWLINTRGVKFGSFSIGGSKALLDNSRNDSLVREQLYKSIQAIEKDFQLELKNLAVHRAKKIVNEFSFSDPFVRNSVTEGIQSILKRQLTVDQVHTALERGVTKNSINLVKLAIIEKLKTDRLQCTTKFPTVEGKEEILEKIVTGFYKELQFLYTRYLEKKIEALKESEKSFVDPFNKKFFVKTPVSVLYSKLGEIDHL